MTLSRRLTAPALVAALLATAACSAGGASVAPPTDASAAAAVRAVSPATTVSQSPPGAASTDDVTAADIAAIDAPATEDVSDPSGDAAGASAFGWTLTGFYHGKLKGYDTTGFGVREKSGYLALHIRTTGRSYVGGGQASAWDGSGAELSFTLSGSILTYFAHGESVSMTAVDDSTGCPASGSARRFRHLFEGVLKSPGCGSDPHPFTYYFKVRPNES